MKIAWHYLSVAVLLCSPTYADDRQKETGVTTYSALPYQSEITFQSRRLPNWQFDVRYNRERPFSPQWVDTINTYHAIDSVRISASRRIMERSSQRVFAAIQTSNDDNLTIPEWTYLPGNAGTAASVGWQIGGLREVNMVVGYEYRQLDDRDTSSLLLDVYYHF